VPEQVRELLSAAKGLRAYTLGEARILVSREPAAWDGSYLWHLSISCADRYPSWDEIHDARYRLVPDEVTMGMLLPPRAEYVNCHPNAFHLWEVYDPRQPRPRSLWTP
jgi:hypothetical protein